MGHLLLTSALWLLPSGASATEGSLPGQRNLSPIAGETVRPKKKITEPLNISKILLLAFDALGESPNQLIQVIALRDCLKTEETYYFCFYLVVTEQRYSPASMSDDSRRDASKAGS